MAKVKLNPVVEQLRGQVGDLVFRNTNGRTVLSRKPDFSDVEPTQEQSAQRERFRQAAIYGRMVLADPQTRQLYEQAAERKGKPAFALTIADFLNAPSVDEVDLSQYGGAAGDPILIRTHDDFGVTAVQVSLADEQGNQLETGAATEEPPGSGRWVYHATSSLSTGTTVRISVVASDRPGGSAKNQALKTL